MEPHDGDRTPVSSNHAPNPTPESSRFLGGSWAASGRLDR